MTSRLVLCLGDLFIPDRVAVSYHLHFLQFYQKLTKRSNRIFQQRYALSYLIKNRSLLTISLLQFKKLLTPGKIGQVLCLGNLTDRETFEFLRAIAPDLQIVKGDFDTEAPNLALSRVVTHGSLRIGFTHGHTIIPPGDADSLLIAARQMDVDVLLWGGTHRFEAFELEGKFFVNPGSATGAMTTGWWPDDEDPTPSFVLMDVRISGGESCYPANLSKL
jgi:vacuolar protein sorting-associated protein 29